MRERDCSRGSRAFAAVGGPGGGAAQRQQVPAQREGGARPGELHPRADHGRAAGWQCWRGPRAPREGASNQRVGTVGRAVPRQPLRLPTAPVSRLGCESGTPGRSGRARAAVAAEVPLCRCSRAPGCTFRTQGPHPNATAAAPGPRRPSQASPAAQQHSASSANAARCLMLPTSQAQGAGIGLAGQLSKPGRPQHAPHFARGGMPLAAHAGPCKRRAASAPTHDCPALVAESSPQSIQQVRALTPRPLHSSLALGQHTTAQGQQCTPPVWVGCQRGGTKCRRCVKDATGAVGASIICCASRRGLGRAPGQTQRRTVSTWHCRRNAV